MQYRTYSISLTMPSMTLRQYHLPFTTVFSDIDLSVLTIHGSWIVQAGDTEFAYHVQALYCQPNDIDHSFHIGAYSSNSTADDILFTVHTLYNITS